MVGCKYKIFIWYAPATIQIVLQQNTYSYPIWASLSHDYLAIMASLVSSEQAFSQGGITVSKCWSHLKGDIIEALHIYKYSLWNNLIFLKLGPSSINEIKPTGIYNVYNDMDKDQVAEDNEGEGS